MRQHRLDAHAVPGCRSFGKTDTRAGTARNAASSGGSLGSIGTAAASIVVVVFVAHAAVNTAVEIVVEAVVQCIGRARIMMVQMRKGRVARGGSSLYNRRFVWPCIGIGQDGPCRRRPTQRDVAVHTVVGIGMLVSEGEGFIEGKVPYDDTGRIWVGSRSWLCVGQYGHHGPARLAKMQQVAFVGHDG